MVLLTARLVAPRPRMGIENVVAASAARLARLPRYTTPFILPGHVISQLRYPMMLKSRWLRK